MTAIRLLSNKDVSAAWVGNMLSPRDLALLRYAGGRRQFGGSDGEECYPYDWKLSGETVGRRSTGFVASAEAVSA
jgi:hypothetical protein